MAEPLSSVPRRSAGAVTPPAQVLAAALAAPSAPVALFDCFRVRTPGVRSPQAHLRVPGRALCPAGPSGGPAAPGVGAEPPLAEGSSRLPAPHPARLVAGDPRHVWRAAPPVGALSDRGDPARCLGSRGGCR